MKYSWRWYGPNDPVSIADVRQTGADEVVTALHHIPNGEVWSIEEIRRRIKDVEWDSDNNRVTGLKWSVVESVPVHEDIKKRTGSYKKFIENYKQTLRNLSKCGIYNVIYNFMPVLDWTRTDLYFELHSGAKALKYSHTAFAAFELFLLKRKGAEAEYTEKEKAEAEEYFKVLTDEKKSELVKTIIAGLPGAEEGFTLEEFNSVLKEYADIDADALRQNLINFVAEIAPVAEEVDINLAVHPDDPPRPILGLPRVMSNIDDIDALLSSVPIKNNGLCLCAGSFGAGADNDLVQMIKKYGDRVHCMHLRSVKREGKDFYEDEHLAGSTDLVLVIKALIDEERRRKFVSEKIIEIPIRPDHGHQIIDDLRKKTNPGYSCIGRLKGLAEIKGIAAAIEKLSL
jgi:mannonate dehydratase